MAITTVQGQMLTAPLTLTGNLTFSDGSVQTAAASPYVLKNRIINGAMVIDQRNAGASVTPTANSYTLDRWKTDASQPSKFTVQQNAGSVTPPTGFTNYYGVTSSSAYTVGAAESFGVYQNIEGYNVADLGFGASGASTITISFWARSSLTGTFGGALNNSAFNRSYPFSYTISSANTWTKISVTVVGDTTGTWLTNNGIGLVCYFSLGTGATSSTTAGAWTAGSYQSATGTVSVVGTNGATFYITGVQLEVGTSATPFERRLYNQELANCQRYYAVFNNVYVRSYNTAGAYIGTTLSLPVTMRTAPTLTKTGTWNTSVNNAQPTVQDSGNGNSQQSFSIYSLISTTTDAYFITVNSGTGITASAEL